MTPKWEPFIRGASGLCTSSWYLVVRENLCLDSAVRTLLTHLKIGRVLCVQHVHPKLKSKPLLYMQRKKSISFFRLIPKWPQLRICDVTCLSRTGVIINHLIAALLWRHCLSVLWLLMPASYYNQECFRDNIKPFVFRFQFKDSDVLEILLQK